MTMLFRGLSVASTRFLIRRGKSVSSSSAYRDRTLYKYFVDFQTRWRDNDVYGHVNNVVYGEWIDSIVNQYLIERCSLEPGKSALVGFVVRSHCEYYSPISYPKKISVGLFVHRIGNSSVDYLVGIFDDQREEKASAVGGFTHVFVNRHTNKSQTIPTPVKEQLKQIAQE